MNKESKLNLNAGNYAISHYDINKTYNGLEVHKMLCDAYIAGNNDTLDDKDDEIRKALINVFATHKDYEVFFGVSVEDILAWLKKQGEETSQSDSKKLSEQIKDFEGEFGCWNSAHDFRPKHLQRCLCYDKYMKGVYCYVYDDISKYWCTQTTEEHDQNGDNHICDYADYRVTVWMQLPDTSFYPSKSCLEKQGEQNIIDYNKELKKCRENPLYFFDKYVKIKLQKNVWTEEDEENMNNILYIFNQLKETSPYKEDDIAEKTINWLKSLKDKIKG